jgi:uncharacterized membrane protein HdeD (DUF308 family)
MKYLISTILVAVGLAIISLGILGIVDPIGTQMANDSDPFGTPQSMTQGIITGILGFIICLSPYLMFRKNKKHENDNNT